MNKRVVALSLACSPLVVAACGGEATPPAASPAPTVTAATTTAASSAAPAAPVVVAPAEPKKEEPVFFPIAELQGEAMLHAVRGGVLVSTVLPDDTERSIGVVENDKLSFPKHLRFEGLGTFNQLSAVRGTWPDDLDVFMMVSDGRIGAAAHVKFGPKGMSRGKGHSGQLFSGAARVGDTTFASLVPAMFYLQTGTEIVTVRGPGRAPKLRRIDRAACADALGLTGDDRKGYLKQGATTDLTPLGFGATGAGTMAAVGITCRGNAFETWPAGASASVVTDIPGDLSLSNDFIQIVPGAGDEAWAFLGKLFHYDGKTWSEVKGAPPSLDSGGARKDGTLWAASLDGKVWKGGTGGFTEVPLPPDVKATQVVVSDDDTVWVLAGNSVLRTKRPTDGAPTIVVKEPAKRPTRAAPLVPGSEKCAKNMVLLYGFTKVTPDDYDFPKTREAVTGHPEFGDVRFQVTKENNKKYFTAMVSSFAQGKKLVSLIESKVQGAKPALLCTDKTPPDVVRDVKIDLKTGAVIK